MAVTTTANKIFSDVKLTPTSDDREKKRQHRREWCGDSTSTTLPGLNNKKKKFDKEDGRCNEHRQNQAHIYQHSTARRKPAFASTRPRTCLFHVQIQHVDRKLNKAQVLFISGVLKWRLECILAVCAIGLNCDSSHVPLWPHPKQPQRTPCDGDAKFKIIPGKNTLSMPLIQIFLQVFFFFFLSFFEQYKVWKFQSTSAKTAHANSACETITPPN